MVEWGVDVSFEVCGLLGWFEVELLSWCLWLLQCSLGKLGVWLGKIIGWIYCVMLKVKGVCMFGGVEYFGVDDEGLCICVDGSEQLLLVDYVVICVGQELNCMLQVELQVVGINVQLIGGVDVVVELDVKCVIDQGSWVVVVF